MKKIVIAALIICLALVVLVSAKNYIAKSILIKAVMQITGLTVQIEDMQIGLLKTWAKIDGLYIFNPAGFSDSLMVDIPRVYIDYDLGSLFKKQVHIESLDLVLKEFVVIKNPEGKLNVNSISGISKPQAAGAQAVGAPSRKPDIKIDALHLAIGRVLYKDYTQVPVMVSEFPVNIDERYENITDPDKLVKLIVNRALVKTAISKLAEIDFNRLQSEISGIINKGKNIFKSGNIEDIPSAVEDITRGLQSIFKIPSGK